MRTLPLTAALAAVLACASALADDSQLLEFSRRCKSAADAKDLSQAMLHCKKANELQPLPETYVNLGSALYANGRYHEAEWYFIEAVNMNPRLAVAHFDLGRVWEVLGKKEQAQNQYKEAAELGDKTALEELSVKNAVADAATQTKGSR